MKFLKNDKQTTTKKQQKTTSVSLANKYFKLVYTFCCSYIENIQCSQDINYCDFNCRSSQDYLWQRFPIEHQVWMQRTSFWFEEATLL